MVQDELASFLPFRLHFLFFSAVAVDSKRSFAERRVRKSQHRSDCTTGGISNDHIATGERSRRLRASLDRKGQQRESKAPHSPNTYVAQRTSELEYPNGLGCGDSGPQSRAKFHYFQFCVLLKSELKVLEIYDVNVPLREINLISSTRSQSTGTSVQMSNFKPIQTLKQMKQRQYFCIPQRKKCIWSSSQRPQRMIADHWPLRFPLICLA